MKKKKIFLLIIMCTIFFVSPVFADTYTKSYCTGLKSSLRIVGEIINILKIVVPLIIVGLANSDLFKVVTSGKDESIFKAVKTIISRIILGILIFFLPSILEFGFLLVDEWTDYQIGYQDCVSCVLNVKKCR